MKTLEKAVDELNALTADEAKALLDKYPNDIPRPRCSECPVARHLAEQVGKPVWVTGSGAVELLRAPNGGPYFLNEIIRGLMFKYDVAAVS